MELNERTGWLPERQSTFRLQSVLLLPFSVGTLNVSPERLPVLMTYRTWKFQSCLILSARIKLALGECGGQVSRRASETNPWGLRKEKSQNVLDRLIFLAHKSQTKLISAEGDIRFVKFLKL